MRKQQIRRMRFIMHNKLVLSISIGFISIYGFSQNHEINTTKTGMSINHNHTGIVRGNTKSTISTKQQTSLCLFKTVEIYEKDAIYANRKPEDELVEKRDRTSKHFQNPDGSIEAILSTGSLNYLENDKWQTIERAITPNNTGKFESFEFANTKNAFKSFYGNTPVNGIKTIIDNQEITEWQNKKIEFYDANMNLISSINEENSKISLNHDKATYVNIFPYTEAQITQLHDGRKIDYEITSEDFLNQIPANAKYIAVSENIELPTGWKAEYFVDKMLENSQADKQQISIFNQKGEEILRYMPPAYFEKENQYDIENPVGEYEILQSGPTLTIKTITEADWFRNENRTFPVVIDPTVSVYPNNTTNWMRSVYNDGGAETAGYFGYVGGYWLRCHMKFNTGTIPTTAIVSSLTGYINIIGAWGAWNGNWQFANSADPTVYSGTSLYNSVNLGYSNIGSFSSSGWKSSVFYPEANQYAENGIAVGSINLSVVPSGTYSPNVYYQFSDQFQTSKPYLSITYTIPSTPPTCTTPISPTDGFGSHSPADPLTWNAAAGATSYDVYFGTSSNPPYVTNVATTSYSPTLADNTTYYWKIVPRNSSGTPTGCAVWEFTTTTGPANGDYRSRYMDGVNRMWSIASNWQIYNGSSWVTASSSPNSSTTNVLIRDNSKMIIDGNYEVNELRIEGLLQFYWGDGATNNTAKTLTVNGDIVLIGDADFQTNAAYDANRNFVHLLIAKGSIYNNANSGHGVLFNDYPEIDYWSYVQVRFRGSGDAEWSGTGENDLGGLSILKNNPDDVVTIKPTQLLGWGSNNLDGNGFFMYDVIDHIGTLKIGGTFAMTTRFGIQSTNTSADDTRQLPQISSLNSGANFTLYIDNPNFGISGYSAIECYGNLRISQGTLNVGNSMDDYIEFGDGSSLTVDGGDLSCTGAVAYLGTGSFELNLSDGRIRAGYLGNSNSNIVGWFDIRNNATVNISGGEIHLINMEFTTTLDYPMYNMAAANVNITGGVLQIGSDVSPLGTNTFSIAGPTPSIELYGNGTNIASNAILWDDVQCYGYLDIPEFCGLSIYDQDNGDIPYTFSITGDINHEGNLWAEVENSKILFNGSSAQTFHTTGAYSDVSGEAGISIVEVDNSAGVQLTGLSTAVTKNFINTNGTFHIGDCSLGLSGIVTRSNGYFGGNSNSELYISGNGTLGNLFFDPAANNLKILEMDRQNSGIVNLATDLNVHQSINFINGTLYTYLDNNIVNGSNTIYLQDYAVLFNENTNSYVYGKVSLTEEVMSAREPGNVGAYFTDLSENLGTTTIIRMTGDEGEQNIADATSIDCYWDINVSTQPTSPVSMSFEWLGNFDNGLSTTNMSVFSKDGVNPWEEHGTPTSVSGNPRTIIADADHFTRWTIAVKDQVLPVSLLYFDVQCKGNNKEFSWATASEINSDYFLIMESQDNENFKPIAKIEAAGNSNQTTEYRYATEGLFDNAYYRLKQVDFDGKEENFSMVYNNCDNDINYDVIVYPNPFNGEEIYINSNTILDNLNIEIFDAAGRIVYKTKLEKIYSSTQLIINKQLEPGAYLLKLNANNDFYKQFVLISK